MKLNNAIAETLENILSVLQNMNTNLIHQSKCQRLEWGISNAELWSFEYYMKDSDDTYDSQDLAKDILLSFREGVGQVIGNESSMTPYGSDSNRNKAGQKRFRKELASQISALTGITPRLEYINNDFTIYYS
jgi:hypothetical protein